VEWVTEDIIRHYFNTGQYYEKAKSGALISYLKRNSHPDQPPSGEPVCTHSQIVYYYSRENSLVVIVHQYYRPDGSIGGSGLPDPKMLVLEGRILAIRAKRNAS